MSGLRQSHVQSAYRPVSIIFALLVLLLIGGVAYAGFSSTVITITPKTTTVNASFPITVATSTSTDPSVVLGTISTEEKSASVTATPSGTGTPVPAHATGQVTISNTTGTTQPLAATTRLRSADGIIVRTKTRVDVPAHGSVVADVIADPLGETGNVGPGKFVIVALSSDLQSKIFGQSTAALTGGLATSNGKSLSLDELTAASNQAEEQVRTAIGTSKPGTVISYEPSSVVSVPKPDIPSATYQVTVTLKVTTITYPAQQIQDLLKAELAKSLPQGQALGKIDDPNVTVQDRPDTNHVALLVSGQAAGQLSRDNPLLKPSAYIGLTVDQVKKKLSDPDTIKKVSVKLSPWWRTTTPEQAERITLIVAQAQS